MITFSCLLMITVYVSAFGSATLAIIILDRDKLENNERSSYSTNAVEKAKFADHVSMLQNSERFKRLQPYFNYYYKSPNRDTSYNDRYNYYLYSINENGRGPTVAAEKNRHHAQPPKITVFSEHNALPGDFVPIVRSKYKALPQTISAEFYQAENVKNIPSPYISVFNQSNALNLKQRNTNIHKLYRPRIIKTHPPPPRNHYKIINSQMKPIQSYTPNGTPFIDIQPTINNYEKSINPNLHQYTIKVLPQHHYNVVEEEEKSITRQPIFIQPPIKAASDYNVSPTPTIYLLTNQKTHPTEYEKEEEYPQQPLESFQSQTHDDGTPQQTIHPFNHRRDNSNNLVKLLSQLDKSNLVETAPNDILNSAKTLEQILKNFKTPHSLKPIIVDEQYDDKHQLQNVGNVLSHTQIYPLETVDGGTPGIPGVDYPTLSSIPLTSFNCKNQRYKGFFGDPNTNCQVWHYCDLNGGQASFLCPNGTIFSQVGLTCDWWFNVKCSSTSQLYVLNERLYKYIIPLVPKFPEDYSGPLVDRYLTDKFKELERKKAMKTDGSDKHQHASSDDQIDI